MKLLERKGFGAWVNIVDCSTLVVALNKMNSFDDIPLPVNRTPGKFMQQLRVSMRQQRLAYTTEKTYVYWVRSFIRYHRYRHPQEMGAAEVDQFLS